MNLVHTDFLSQGHQQRRQDDDVGCGFHHTARDHEDNHHDYNNKDGVSGKGGHGINEKLGNLERSQGLGQRQGHCYDWNNNSIDLG